MATPAHIYEIFVKATPERVWQAITDPEYTTRYFHATAIESAFTPGAGYRYVMADGRDAVEGVVEHADPPKRLVMTWHTLYDEALAAEPPSRVEWQLAPANDDGTVTRVTLRHFDLARSPGTWANVRLGWVGVLDGMKTLLETGAPLGDVDTRGGQPLDADAEGEWHRSLGIEANNATWELLRAPAGTVDDADGLLASAYAAAYHWRRAARRGPENAARASWLISRAHVVLGHGELALHHAERCRKAVADHGLADFDLAYAHESMARALACLGRLDEAVAEYAAARAVPIADDDDRAIVEADLEAEPWFEMRR
jgi:uncharacterized protein YndB with AHSA1/START domain